MDLLVLKEILNIFGQAMGLFTSLEKFLATPIHCTDEQKQLIQDVMHCEISEFPCRYLGVLLSISKLKKNDEQALVDAVASRIPTWKGKLLNLAGRAVTLSAIPTHMYLNFALPIALGCSGNRQAQKGFPLDGQ